MKLYLAHEPHMIPSVETRIKVNVPANNAGIEYRAQGNCPDAAPDLMTWLRANCKDDVYMGHYEAIREGIDKDPRFQPVDHFEVPLWFGDANQAMMFKLAWCGL